jgi:hypothetical protein
MDGLDIAAGYTAMAAQSVQVQASTAVLAKALKAETGAAAVLIDSMLTAAPMGSVGNNVDVRA